MTRDIPYIGVTRFSVVSPKNTGVKLSQGGDRERYLRELFDEKRLMDRMLILGEVAAPIYQSFAERYDYTHLIQISPELPARWVEELDKLSERYPAIKPVEVTEKDMFDSVREELRSRGSGYRGIFVWLRVDDDDILAADYLDALSSFVSPDNVGMAVSYSSLVSGIYVNGDFSDFRRVRAPYTSLGQAFICRANLALDTYESPPVLPHHVVDEFIPTITSAIEPYAFWTRHILQDTSAGGSKIGARFSNLQAYLGKFPHFPLQDFDRKFPTLSQKLFSNSETDWERSLNPGEWIDASSWFTGWPSNSVVRMDYRVSFRGDKHDGTTISFGFLDEDAVSGQFPRDDARGDYRRLYVDPSGEGTIIIFLPDPASLSKVRIQADPGKSPIELVELKTRSLGEIDEP